MPSMRAAALMRWIHSERKSRLRCLRERYMCIHACCAASLAMPWQLERLPRKPLAAFRMRLRRRRALKPRFARGMADSLLVRQQLLDLMMVRGHHVAGGAQLALALLAPAGQQVALEHPLVLELAGRRPLEPLLGAAMCLDLGHRKARSYARSGAASQVVSAGLGSAQT